MKKIFIEIVITQITLSIKGRRLLLPELTDTKAAFDIEDVLVLFPNDDSVRDS